jgi:hypothetical protein
MLPNGTSSNHPILFVPWPWHKGRLSLVELYLRYIMGVTVILDPSIIDRLYPDRIVAERKVGLLSFDTKKLHPANGYSIRSIATLWASRLS